MASKLPVAKTGPFPRNIQADRAVTVTLACSGRDAEVKANTDCTDRNIHHKYPTSGPPRIVTELHLRTLQPHRSKASSGCQSQAWIRVPRPPVCSAERTEQPVPRWESAPQGCRYVIQLSLWHVLLKSYSFGCSPFISQH